MVAGSRRPRGGNLRGWLVAVGVFSGPLVMTSGILATLLLVITVLGGADRLTYDGGHWSRPWFAQSLRAGQAYVSEVPEGVAATEVPFFGGMTAYTIRIGETGYAVVVQHPRHRQRWEPAAP